MAPLAAASIFVLSTRWTVTSSSTQSGKLWTINVRTAITWVV